MYQALKKFADDRSNGRDGETYIFFVGRENYPLYWTENAKYPWGKAQVLREGTRRRPDRMRPLLNKQSRPGRSWRTGGIKAAVINNPFINRVDVETIGEW